MANDEGQAPKSGGRIEGGVDAVVVGASFEGLGAAAMLGKAGLKTILLGAGGASLDDARREFEPGYFCLDGEQLVTHLDPELISAVELYRHGLEFANRRLDSVYYFADGSAAHVDGDPYNSREAIAEFAPGDAARYTEFLELSLETARALRPLFSGAAAPPIAAPLAGAAERYLTASVEDVVDAAFEDERLISMLTTESLFRGAPRAGEAFSFASYIRRLAGEAAGLQGAAAFAKDGAHGVRAAARRAAQAARVDFRPATGVTRVLVEWDRVAGVETSDGGQIRAPVVVNALDARRAFVDLIGPELLDIEFQAGIESPAPRFGEARVHFAMNGEPRDERTLANMTRRLVYAPAREEIAHAFASARRGEVEGPLIMEAIFPSAFDPTLAPEKACVVSAIVHPVPFRSAADDAFREQIAAAARLTFERIAPGAGARIIATDVRIASDEANASGAPARAFASPPGVVAAWARSRKLAGAAGIEGYFFCGPEARIGLGLNGAAGRRAAQAAIRYARQKVHG